MRPNINQTIRNQSGSALVAVVLVGIVAMILTLVVMRSTGHGIKKAGDRRGNVVLLNIAEAGKEHAIGLVKSRQVTLIPNATVDVVNCSSFNGGAYVVSCSSNVSSDTLFLKSTATYKGNTKSIEVVCNMVSSTLSGEALNM
jgi:Tfp pilus assembly protein PilX